VNPADCAVLVPVARDIEPETQEALSELQARGYVVRILRGGSQVDLVRSAMASKAVQDGFAETLWIDSDVMFNPDDVERIRLHGKPITAGLYVKKTLAGFACKFKPAQDGMTFGVGGGLVELEYAGMGFTHVRREVYEAVARVCDMPKCGGNYDPALTITPYFIPMVIPEGEGHCYLSEDYSFCYRARLAGFEPMADTRIKLGHAGRRVLTWDDLLPRDTIETLTIGIA
jgi:hypothetical protein